MRLRHGKDVTLQRMDKVAKCGNVRPPVFVNLGSFIPYKRPTAAKRAPLRSTSKPSIEMGSPRGQVDRLLSPFYVCIFAPDLSGR